MTLSWLIPVIVAVLGGLAGLGVYFARKALRASE